MKVGGVIWGHLSYLSEHEHLVGVVGLIVGVGIFEEVKEWEFGVAGFVGFEMSDIVFAAIFFEGLKWWVKRVNSFFYIGYLLERIS